jgi:hypothetical protein
MKAILFFPVKSTKIILEKIITKKNHVGKYCSNPQYFVRKAIVLSPYVLALLYKDNFGKNHNKKQKTKPRGEILQQSTVF